MNNQYVVVLCTCPNDVVAGRLAESLVEEKLSACVNRLPRMSSTYRWEGKIQTESESLLIIKTRRTLYDRLAQRIAELYPYEVPEIIALPVETGLERYFDWMDQSLD